MVLGLATHGRDRSDGNGGDEGTEKRAGLTEADLHRIRSVAATPRFMRTPEMLCPDEPADRQDEV